MFRQKVKEDRDRDRDRGGALQPVRPIRQSLRRLYLQAVNHRVRALAERNTTKRDPSGKKDQRMNVDEKKSDGFARRNNAVTTKTRIGMQRKGRKTGDSTIAEVMMTVKFNPRTRKTKFLIYEMDKRSILMAKLFQNDRSVLQFHLLRAKTKNLHR